jgi:hypothetical protein
VVIVVVVLLHCWYGEYHRNSDEVRRSSVEYVYARCVQVVTRTSVAAVRQGSEQDIYLLPIP